jgi:hypothetical protein
MSKSKSVLARLTLVLAGISSFACNSQPATEPGAVAEVHKQEVPGTHDPSDVNPVVAQRWIDKVHLGRSIDASGQVHDRTDDFTLDDPVYVSMEVTDTPAGSKVLVAVVDARTDRELWRDSKTVESGKSYLAFEVDRSSLGSGQYRADVFVADERVARRSFEISA